MSHEVNEEQKLQSLVSYEVLDAAQKQINAAYRGDSWPVDTAKNVDAIMKLIKSHSEAYAAERVRGAIDSLNHNSDWSASREGSRTKKWEAEGYRRALRDIEAKLTNNTPDKELL